MQKILYLTLAALALASSPVMAAAPGAETVTIDAKSGTGRAVGQAITLEATVTAVDLQNRTATIKLPDGTSRTFAVGPEVKNLDQVKVGDILTVKYVQALLVKLEETPGATPSKTVSEELTRAKKGEKPHGRAQRTTTVVGTVTKIDNETQVVTVRAPDGADIDIKVQDPAKLKKVKMGDLVRVVYKEAAIISVATPAPEKAKTK